MKKSAFIEEIGGSDEDEDEENIESWEIEQKIDESALIGSSSYGFANRQTDVFQRLEEEALELFDRTNIATVPNAERTNMRLDFEENKFNEDHYLADMFDPDDGLVAALSYRGFWSDSDTCLTLSDDETAVLVSMRKKSLPILDSDETIKVYSGLVELLFAYAYAQRCFAEALEPEAAWMIAKISPMLSWLDTTPFPRKALESCYRRCLCYPLYRSWTLCSLAQRDVSTILNLGRIAITKILLEIRSLFNRRDPFYLMSQLYLDEYIIWLQSRALAENLKMLSKNVATIKVRKRVVDLDLEQLEAAARLVLEEDEMPDADVTTMEEAMAQLGIQLGNDGEFRSELEDEIKSMSHRERERDTKPPLISEI